MAKKTTAAGRDETPESDPKKALLLELRDRYTKCVDHDRKNREKYRENMRFTLVPGEQWDPLSRQERGKDRVMYEFNEVRIKCKAVVNQIRSNRPSAKITPAEDGDIELAEAMKGLIDQIWNASDGDSVIDYATEHQVIGGMGAARFITKYCQDSVDEQDLVLEQIKNPLCLYADYACQKQDKSDARFWIYAAKLAKEVYKTKYPKAETVEFSVEDSFSPECDDESVWVAEYWKQVPVVRELQLLSNGETVEAGTYEALPPDVTVVKSRRAPGFKVVQYICSGDAILEGPNEWAGREFPFMIAYGEYAVIEGKEIWYGLPEHGKDAQRAHNWAATSVYETIASTPQGTTWVTEVQAKDLTAEWAEAQRKNIRIKRYNHDQRAPGPPVSEPAAAVPTALVAAMQMSSDSLKAVLGMPDSTLGETGKENSGVAIRRRQEAGAVANYNFGDNMTKFVRRAYAIMLDVIPKIYDTQRTIRVLGKDGAEKWIKINAFDPVTQQPINDLSAAKLDLVVTQGPNFATQRQEAAETYMGMQQTNPVLGQVAGDLIFKALDLPYAQEISERLKATLPAPIQAMLNKDKPQDPAVIAAMQQLELQQAQLQEQAQLVEQATQEAQSDKSSADKAKADIQIASANLQVQQAQLATDVANFKTLVAQTEARFAQQDAADKEASSAQEKESIATERQELVDSIAVELDRIQQQSEQLQVAQQQLAQALLEMQAQPPKPVTPKTMSTKRVNGGYVTHVRDEATGTEAVAVSERQPGGEMITRLKPTGTVQ